MAPTASASEAAVGARRAGAAPCVTSGRATRAAPSMAPAGMASASATRAGRESTAPWVGPLSQCARTGPSFVQSVVRISQRDDSPLGFEPATCLSCFTGFQSAPPPRSRSAGWSLFLASQVQVPVLVFKESRSGHGFVVLAS